MEKDRSIFEAFLDHMTINVTELFRNAELFKVLQEQILPELIKNNRNGMFKAWSAGCSYGAEANTLAIILSELIPTMNFQVKGTDIDLAILAKAANPTFSAMDMQSVTKSRRDKHFMTLDEKTFMPIGPIKRALTFSPHDLLADSYPTASYDLILCRNVVIYFNDEAKDRIFRGFFQALKPGGALFVGGTERLNDHHGIGFELIRPFFYRKPLLAKESRVAA